MAVSYETKHALTTQPSNCSQESFTRNKNLGLHKILYMNVHSTIINVCQNLGGKCSSTDEWLNKPYGISISLNITQQYKETTYGCVNLNGSQFSKTYIFFRLYKILDVTKLQR